MIRRPPRSTPLYSSAASDGYKRQDKESYLVGETASITVPAGGKGRALVTVENGTKVISAEWREVSGTELKYDIEITPEMAPNAFISVTMVSHINMTTVFL